MVAECRLPSLRFCDLAVLVRHGEGAAVDGELAAALRRAVERRRCVGRQERRRGDEGRSGGCISRVLGLGHHLYVFRIRASYFGPAERPPRPKLRLATSYESRRTSNRISLSVLWLPTEKMTFPCRFYSNTQNNYNYSVGFMIFLCVL
jgi:hypothetical protein